MNWTEALGIVQAGFDEWAAKPHNKKWFKRIDGTPIPNDLVVCIATAIARRLNATGPNQESRNKVAEGGHACSAQTRTGNQDGMADS